MADLHDRDGGFLVNDTLNIQTVVEMRTDARYLPADSREETGFVGLKNQGATCYLNSLIQTLYHLPVFRKAVYLTPTSNHILSESISLALQSLFYKIQHTDTSPGTEDLTKSFGWDQSQCLIQQDARKLNLILLNRFDEEMRDTPVEGTIQELFEGLVTTNYLDFAESFYDLQLDVKGCKDVYASLDKMCVGMEKLDGDDQYVSEEQFCFPNMRGLERGLKFIDFPPILLLQLKRVVYDCNQKAMMKVNDRYEFPWQLDLDRENRKYLSEVADRRVRNVYTLQSVLVHRGSRAESGHYYVFIRPTLSDQWYKFDDELVTKEESKTVLEEHCGADDDQSHSSAYMLLYIRESEKDKILCTIEQEDIPVHVQVRFKESEEEAKRSRDVKKCSRPISFEFERELEAVQARLGAFQIKPDHVQGSRRRIAKRIASDNCHLKVLVAFGGNR